MNAEIKKSTEDLNHLVAAFVELSRKTGDMSKTITDDIKKNTHAEKNQVSQLNDAIGQFNAKIKAPELERSITLIERLVEALEKVAELQKAGVLDALLKATAGVK